jgi:hypothetical protein
MGGVATVTPGKYLSRPDYTTDATILAQKQDIGKQMLEGQIAGLQTQEKLFDLYSKTQPLLQSFDAERTSKEAGELGLSNLARSRQYEQMASPASARMRQQLPEQVEQATSPAAFQDLMDQWLQKKGIARSISSGVDPSSTFGRSSIADMSTEEGRRKMLENISIRQGFLGSQQAPTGGLDPGALIGGRMASESQNLGALADWQRNIFAGAQQMGEGLGQSRQNAYEYLSKNMGEILNLQQTQRANRRMQEQQGYDAAVQNAQSQNARTGALIGAGAGVGGAAIGAAAIII